MSDEKLRALVDRATTGRASATDMILELAADHDAEVKRLKAGEETLIGVNKILGDEVTRLTELAYSKDALLLSSQDEVTRLKAANTEMARRNGNLRERLAAADARLAEVDSCGACIGCMVHDHRFLTGQSPASETLPTGPACTCAAKASHRHAITCYWFDASDLMAPSQPAPDVTAQLDHVKHRLFKVEALAFRLETRVSALAECLDMNGLRGVPKSVAALEPNAKHDANCDTGTDPAFPCNCRLNPRSIATKIAKPVPEPPLVTDHAFVSGPSRGTVDICWHITGGTDCFCGLLSSRHASQKERP